MKIKLLLVLVILLSFSIRIFKIENLPSILNRDEAALAYNALLINSTLKDEWGKHLPLALESFGDYKLPGYVYFLAILYNFMPPSDWVVRLPSALAGSLLIAVAYFFARALKFSKGWSFIFSLLIATTPVFFFYSRIAFEANLALFLFVSSLTLLINFVNDSQSIKKSIKIIKLLLALLFMFLAVFTYNTPLLLLPFVIIFLILLVGVKKVKSYLPAVFGLIIIFLIALVNLKGLAAQKSSITIFQDELLWRNSVLYRQQFQGWLRPILGNKYFYYLGIILKNYLASFSLKFNLYSIGGHPWHSVPNTGHLLIPTYILGFVGLLSWLVDTAKAIFIQKKANQKMIIKIMLTFLFFSSLLPAVITVDAPHATRSLFYFFLFNLMALVGLKNIYAWVTNKMEFLGVSLFMIAFSFAIYLSTYFANYPLQQITFKPGFKRVIGKAEQSYSNQKIAIVDEEGYHYILLAWYLKMNPATYFKTNIRQLPDKIGFRYGEQVGRYHFIADAKDRRDDERVIIQWSGKVWKIDNLNNY
jgi:4-amino-4-deoxy-L-arabinose transferase-like glycosyltransferase